MEELSLDSAIAAIRNYTDVSDVRTPFFVVFSTRMDVVQIKNRLSSCSVVRLSDFCGTTHSLPDEDRLVEHLLHQKQKAILLLGVGEYAALAADDSLIDRLFRLEPERSKIVVPIWNGYDKLNEISGVDPRIVGRHCISMVRQNKHWQVKVFKPGLLERVDADGFKALLRRLEDGCDGVLTAMTAVRLNSKWCRNIDSSYAIYKERHPESVIPEMFFSEVQWKNFCDDSRERDERIDSADRCLEAVEGSTACGYLQQVIARTERYADWRRNLFATILSINASDASFRELYNERKDLISDMDKDSIADYVAETRRFSDPEVQLCYLTTTTDVELAEIFSTLGRCRQVPINLKWVYPELCDYLRSFKFTGGEIAGVLSRYFDEYKRQKVKNQIEPLFSRFVRELSENRPQFELPSRESILEKLDDGKSCLCWIDALGCEWLGYIQAVAEREGMKLKVTPSRAMLPTLTSVNRGFYDGWKGPKLDKNEELDKIKHGDFACGPVDCKAVPIHLSKELDILARALAGIKKWLVAHHNAKVVLTSDHGATRLAVISDSYTVWEMPTKGKHGGRCCWTSEFDGDLPSCSTKSDDGEWHVLAGHDRFRGGRVGDVEVHGGATLEEMVVPVIELELLGGSIRVELTQSKYKVTYRDAEIELKLFSTANLSNPSLEFGGSRYPIRTAVEGVGHYLVNLPKVSTGDYSAEVYDGDTKISTLEFSVISGGASVNKDFF